MVALWPRTGELLEGKQACLRSLFVLLVLMLMLIADTYDDADTDAHAYDDVYAGADAHAYDDADAVADAVADADDDEKAAHLKFNLLRWAMLARMKERRGQPVDKIFAIARHCPHLCHCF